MVNKRELLKNPCFLQIPEMHDVVSQYFKNIDMHFFGYGSVYPNGKFSILNSKHGWAEDIFAEKQLPPIGFNIYDQITDKVFFPTMDKGDILGWPDDLAIESKQKFNILQPMMITRKYESHYEIYIFDLHDPQAYEKYLNQFELFENFVHYYKDKANKLIEKAKKNPFTVDPLYLPTKSIKNSANTINHPSALIIPQLKRYYLRHKDQDIALSAKEYFCLSLLAHGKQIKRISTKMGVSIRTVETYFERIKKKLNLSTRDELAKAYWENRILSG